jgi:SnoaL-like polyketide cyclase
MNKDIIWRFIDSVWQRRHLDALPEFWTTDCVNHALRPSQRGLESLRAYHEEQFKRLEGFSNMRTELVQQIEEEERVVTRFSMFGGQNGLYRLSGPCRLLLLRP